MKPGDLIIVDPAPSGEQRYGRRWNTDFGKLSLSNDTILIKLDTKSVYVILTSVNDRFSDRWSLITNGSVISWVRHTYLTKIT